MPPPAAPLVPVPVSLVPAVPLPEVLPEPEVSLDDEDEPVSDVPELPVRPLDPPEPPVPPTAFWSPGVSAALAAWLAARPARRAPAAIAEPASLAAALADWAALRALSPAVESEVPALEVWAEATEAKPTVSRAATRVSDVRMDGSPLGLRSRLVRQAACPAPLGRKTWRAVGVPCLVPRPGDGRRGAVAATVRRMTMLRGLALLLTLQALGEAVARLTGLRVPGPVIGLVLLLPLLAWTPVREAVAPVAETLLGHLSLLFVPAGVGVVTHLHVVARHGPGLLLALVVSTAVGMAVTALVMRACLPPSPPAEEAGRDE